MKKVLSYVSVLLLAVATLPLQAIYADNAVVPTPVNNATSQLSAQGFIIENDKTLSSQDVLDHVTDTQNAKLSVNTNELNEINAIGVNGGYVSITVSDNDGNSVSVPVVKKGNLVVTNERGALIFNQVTLDKKLYSAEEVLAQTGAYSVNLSDGAINHQLDVNKTATGYQVVDSNLGLEQTFVVDNQDLTRAAKTTYRLEVDGNKNPVVVDEAGLRALTDQKLIEMAKPVIKDDISLQHPELIQNITVNQAELEQAKAATTYGPYAVTIDANIEGQALTAKVWVNYVDKTPYCQKPNGQNGTYANTYVCKIVNTEQPPFIRYSERDTITPEEIVARAGAKMWNAGTGEAIQPAMWLKGNDTSLMEDIKTATINDYLVATLVPQGVDDINAPELKRQIKIAVIPDSAVQVKKFVVDGNNFSITVDEAKALTDDMIKQKGNVISHTYADTNKDTPPVYDPQQLAEIKKGIPGVYPLTITNGEASKTIMVSVEDDNTTCNAQGCIYAENFTYNLSEAKNLDDQTVIDLAHARAWYKDKTDQINVVVNQDQLNAIKQAQAPGVFQLEFSAQELGGLTRPINVTLLDDNYNLTANNFNVNANQVANITAEQVIQMSGAASIQPSTQQKGTITVTPESLEALRQTTKGVVEVTLGVQEQPGVTTTIKVNVVPEGAVAGDKATIFAQDFEIELADVANLDEAQVKTLANAEAWYNNGEGTPTINVDAAQLDAIKQATTPQKLPLTFSVADDPTATKTINVTIVNTAKPVINGVKDQEITVGTAFDPMAGVTANQGPADITKDVVVSCKDPNGKVTPTFNSMVIGAHTVTYTVTTQDGQTVTETATITVKPITLPGQDAKPGTEDDVIVTPNPEGKPPVINPDGNVTLPDGGDTTFPGGGGVVVPPNTSITPDGVITPENGKPIIPLPPTNNTPNGQIELPGDDGNINDKPDNPVITPQGPNKPSLKPDGSVTLPDGGDINYPHNPNNPGGTITTPPGSVVTPDGTVQTPDGGQVDTDESGSIVLPGQDGNLGTNDDVQVNPGGNGDVTINPDGSVTVPNGGTITFPNNPENNNQITFPNDSTIGQNGQVTPPGANVKPVLPNANGTITIPGADGNLGTPDDGTVTPNGNSTINPDGSITLPGGGTVSLPGECQITVEPGGVVLPNGAVINPGANGVLDTPGYGNKVRSVEVANDDVYLDPAVVCAIPTTKPTVTPEAKPQTPTGVKNATIGLGLVIVIAGIGLAITKRNRK